MYGYLNMPDKHIPAGLFKVQNILKIKQKIYLLSYIFLYLQSLECGEELQ